MLLFVFCDLFDDIYLNNEFEFLVCNSDGFCFYNVVVVVYDFVRS